MKTESTKAALYRALVSALRRRIANHLAGQAQGRISCSRAVPVGWTRAFRQTKELSPLEQIILADRVLRLVENELEWHAAYGSLQGVPPSVSVSPAPESEAVS